MFAVLVRAIIVKIKYTKYFFISVSRQGKISYFHFANLYVLKQLKLKLK